MKTRSFIGQFRQDSRLSLEEFGNLLTPPVHKTTVMRWEAKGVPVSRVQEIERLTDVSRHILRPDIFGPSPHATTLPEPGPGVSDKLPEGLS